MAQQSKLNTSRINSWLVKETCLLMPQASLLLAQLWIKKLFPQIPTCKNDWGHDYDKRWLFILCSLEKRHSISLFMGKSHSKKWQWQEVNQKCIFYIQVFFLFFVHWVKKTNYDHTEYDCGIALAHFLDVNGTTETVSLSSVPSTSNLLYCWNPHPHLVSSWVLWGKSKHEPTDVFCITICMISHLYLLVLGEQ